jgi:nucleoside-diphosphate-sugar epimerase
MILVTGATGHLGANLVRHLVSEGVDVRVLLRPGSDNRSLDGLRVERAFGDLRDQASLTAAVSGCRQVYHCAAVVSTLYRNHDELFATNVLGTRNILAAAREAGVRKVVVSGSFSATGHREDGPTDETEPFNPLERHLPYGQTKAAVEHECLKAAVEGLDVVTAVSCAILGPNDFKPSRMGRVLIKFASHRLLAYIPGGFEFVAANDIVQGHLLAMEKGRPGRKYIFSTEFRTFDDLMALFARVTGQARLPLRLPSSLMAGFTEIGSAIMTLVAPEAPQLLNPAAIRLLRMNRRTSCRRAHDELGYRPTSIEAAVEQAYADFVDRGVLARRVAISVASTAFGTRP